MRIILDIETIPLPEAKLAAMKPEFNPEDVKLGNTKDPEKVSAAIEAARQKHETGFFDNAALSARTGQVAMVGLLAADKVNILEGSEKDILTATWKALQPNPTKVAITAVGYNTILFDIPYLCRRSWINGVQIPVWVLDDRHYPNRKYFRDLREMWQCGDRQESHGGLDGLCKAFGILGKMQGVTGKDFPRLFIEDIAKARQYLEQDLRATASLANAMIGFDMEDVF
jgi:hypothetical protein